MVRLTGSFRLAVGVVSPADVYKCIVILLLLLLLMCLVLENWLDNIDCVSKVFLVLKVLDVEVWMLVASEAIVPSVT